MDEKQIVEPWIDIRSIFQDFAAYLSYFGIALNAILIYLIFFKTDKKLLDYKIILIQNCFVDVFFNIVNDVVKGQTDYKNGSFYMIGGDFIKSWSYPYNFLGISFWVFALFCCVISIPVQFVYRYFIIVRGRILKRHEYYGLLSSSIISAAIFGITFGWVTWADESLLEVKTQLLKTDIFYFRSTPIFMVAEIQKWPLKLCFAYGYLLVNFSYGTTIWSSYKVWKKLKDEAIHFSAETRKMHQQMTKTMILQALVPLIFVLIPVGSAMTSAFALINIPGLGMIISSMVCWIPVVNPLVTIISVKTYRKFVSYFVRKYVLRRKISSEICNQNNAWTASGTFHSQKSLPR